MSIDPQVIRSEQHGEIGSLIQRDVGILIDRWCRRAIQEQPRAARVHHAALLDHLPTFLWALGRSLAESDHADTTGHTALAADHGGQRWEAGWSLTEVIRDYQILRLVLVDYLEEVLDRPPSSREVMAVGLALDEAIAASVRMYAANREEHVRRAEEEKADALRQQAEALELMDRRKDEFLAVLAHELRNPLAPILNSVQLLQMAAPSDPTVVQVRDILDRQTRQLARLVDDLSDLSRVARGRLPLHTDRLDLAAVVHLAVQTCEPLVRSRRHVLSVTLPPAPLWLVADKDRLVQVLVNLLNNAAKYTDPGGHVLVAAAREGDEAVVRVADNGVGITPDKLPRVFELFVQEERSLDRAQGGLGIGLALVKRLVELHGGRVEAHSAGQGQGSEFVVRLPALPVERAGEGAAAAVNNHGSRGRHVLIIEDHADGRKSLCTLLGLLGHRVEAAEDGPAGVDLVLRSRPQVALIDLGLPGLDGYGVARKLRAELGGAVYLVALTGFGQNEDRRKTQEAGFDAHLVKPVDVQELTRLFDSLPAPARQG
jgi:signal transduction histidine kinase/CheY-like chemotaxis protein